MPTPSLPTPAEHPALSPPQKLPQLPAPHSSKLTGNHNSTVASGGAHPTNRTVATDVQEGTLPRISGAVADHQEGSLAAPNVSIAKVELSTSNDQ